MGEVVDNQFQYILSELGTRIGEIESRTGLLKERMLLINANFISVKEELDEKIMSMEKQNVILTSEVKKINSTLKNILSDVSGFVRKDEIVLVERMLKDFQPLEFMRRKDVEEMIKEKLGQNLNETIKEKSKGIKRGETIKYHDSS